MKKTKRKLVLVSQRLRPLVEERELSAARGGESLSHPPCTDWDTGCRYGSNSTPQSAGGSGPGNGLDG